MTEKELAATLGLAETAAMTTLRAEIMRLAPRDGEPDSDAFITALRRYQQLGTQAMEAMENGAGAEARAHIALLLLSAGIRHAIAVHNPTYHAYWEEDLDDALMYACGIHEPDLALAISQLLAQGPASSPTDP